jgi:hypothetical protein
MFPFAFAGIKKLVSKISSNACEIVPLLASIRAFHANASAEFPPALIKGNPIPKPNPNAIIVVV